MHTTASRIGTLLALSLAAPSPAAYAGAVARGVTPAGDVRTVQDVQDDGKRKDPFVDLEIADARSRAEREGKLLLVFWVSPTYRECDRMRASTWTDGDLVKWAMEKTVPVVVDATVDVTAASANNVRNFPTVDLIHPVEGLLERQSGFQTASQLLGSMLGALAGEGTVTRPDGANAEDPLAWLAYANSKWREPEQAIESVRAYVWCLTHGDKHSPGFRRRYFEFICQRIAFMKAATIEALRALKTERERLEGRAFQGIASRRDIYELVRTDFWLRYTNDTKETFISLGGLGEPQDRMRALLFPYVLADLGAWRKYDDLLAGADGDPVAYIKKRFATLDAAAALVDENGISTQPEEERDSQPEIVMAASWLYEGLLHAGLGKDAKDLLTLVTKRVNTGRAWALFMERSSRLELWDLSIQTGEAGLASVKPAGKKPIKRALSMIPAYKEKAAAGDAEGDGGF